jgi:hypothetical protein
VHGRAASVGLSGGAVGEEVAREEWSGGGGKASGVGG